MFCFVLGIWYHPIFQGAIDLCNFVIRCSFLMQNMFTFMSNMKYGFDVCVVSFSTAITSLRKRELIALCFRYFVTFVIWVTARQNQQNDMWAQPRLRSVWVSALSAEYSLCAQWVANDPSFLHADSEDSDQSGRMPRLIWVCAGRTYYFVGFVMRRLICP